MLRKDFLWGGAVTAHQSEGGYNEGGKVPAVCDLTTTGEFSDFKDGIDTYHRYKEDFDLYQEMGFNAYRFSIDWSRMMSDEKTYNEAGFEFYDEFIDEFIRKSTFYQFEYLVPLEQIYFDNYEDLSNDDKQCHIIIKTLQRLYFCKYDPLFNEEDNPTIGIIDNITLSEKYLINKIKIC